MRVRFWGTRGSLPVSLSAADVRGKIHEALRLAAGRELDSDAAIGRFIDEELPATVAHTYGGNSPCVEIEVGTDEYVLCDMGSGLRPFAQQLLEREGPQASNTFHVFMSHVHWDHIMGFPFFIPAYLPGNRIIVYGCHGVIEEALRSQHAAPCFPVDFGLLGAEIEFVPLEPGATQEIGGLQVTTKLQQHSGDSYGYRFERDGKCLVYSTDGEHKLDSAEEMDGFVSFFKDADLVIFDAMYSMADAVTIREDWGHSSNIVGVDLCHLARAKHYCMFHHEPACDDEMIQRVLEETIRYEELMRQDHELKISSAYDGLELDV